MLLFCIYLHVIFAGRRGAVAVVFGGSTGSAGARPAEAAQQTPGQYEQHPCGPAYENTRAQLSLLRLGDQRVVKVAHDVVGGPADRDDNQQARQDQADGGHQGHFGLDVLVVDAGGEVCAGAQDEHGQDGQHAADDGHGSSRLQV